VSFGEPVSLREYLSWRAMDLRTLPPIARQAEMERLGAHLMNAVGKVVPALPVSLVATVILAAGETALTRFELKGCVFDLINSLEAAGAYVHVPRQDRDYAIDVGLRMLTQRHIVLEAGGDSFRANPDEMALLRYYANSIRHLVPERIGTAS